MFDEEEKAQEVSQAQRDLYDAVEAIYNTPEGKKFIMWLIALSGIDRSRWSNDAEVSAFNAGEQNIGHKIVAVLDAVDPRFYPSLLLGFANNETMAASSKSDTYITDEDED